MPLLTLDGVAKEFANGVEALRDISLSVERGEFLALLGASGCGKTTLLRLIAGLTEPSGGRVGWSAEHQAGGPARIGYVFQEPTLMPWATVFGNVYLPLRLQGVSKRDAKPRIRRVLEQVGLGDFATAYPRQLSGGMRMRASIARALVTEPDILLLDEPFAALDELTRFKLNEDLLRLWHDRRLTVVFVTHSVFESVFLATRIVMLKSHPGRIAAELPIKFSVARDAALRTTAEFGRTCGAVSETLARAGAVAA
jgi:NitT/TauT family transport system ATP-binding protein